MTESKKRRVHPPEFKAKVGLEALGGMKTINQIAQEDGRHPIQVGQWKREIQAQAKKILTTLSLNSVWYFTFESAPL